MIGRPDPSPGCRSLSSSGLPDLDKKILKGYAHNEDLQVPRFQQKVKNQKATCVAFRVTTANFEGSHLFSSWQERALLKIFSWLIFQ
ncbi:MAG: hypothetical protein CO149_04300 [Nitrospirae bacterium CG_4_9_14_3_um_filter_51_5]|nr:MAG: hypothetical protein CO149_04300 [Nitrospirae bacterium CG_4_9_14_3_um_filter_51_5]